MSANNVYSISGYGQMIADQERMQAYVQALRKAVKPGGLVVDIGTGTGIFAMLACQFGARRVYAVEPDDAIHVARQMAATNGLADRITFMQGLSTEVSLPEQPDVMISDLHGVLPLFQHHIPSIADARRRLLAPGGILIPRRDTMWAAVVETPDLYREHLSGYQNNGYGLDLQAGRRLVSNTWRKARVKPEQLLLQPQCWAELDYTIIQNPNVKGEMTWKVEKPGTGHGLSVWFDAMLAEGIGFSNAPDAPEVIYGQAFFPWAEPVNLAAGDTVTVTLHADLVGDDYIWRWDTKVLDQGKPGHIKADFKQSTFFGLPLSPESLHKTAASYTPALNKDGQIDQFCLTLMDGETALDEITRQLMEHFPGRFTTYNDALTYMGELSKKYSQ